MLIVLLLAAMILGCASMNDRTQERLDKASLTQVGDVHYMPAGA